MEANNDNDSVSYAKKNLAINKDCKHKFKTVYGRKQICVKCGFVKWW
jgi:hypothetical protein